MPFAHPLPVPAVPAASEASHPGTRRRRLWELGSHAHCPVVGVCLPITVLRSLAGKVLGGEVIADDYELHCGAIAECKLRSPMAEAVQRELDRRCLLALRQAAKAKTADALAAWWHDAARGHDLAGALWATLTHARCTPALEQQVLGDVHMLQHQVGTARRVDLQRFEALREAHGALERELAATQQRSARQAHEHVRRSEQQQGEIVRLRGELIGRDTALAALRTDLQALQAEVPALKARHELAAENARLLERVQELQRGLAQAQQAAEHERRRATVLERDLQRHGAAPADSGVTADADAEAELQGLLHDRAVLCVGGRPASVPVYRQLIEGTGGRFLHHDGGEEDNAARLDSTLAAADLVICQTGCISHGAYWRVKDHCKRTGKRCVFVETPSGASLRRALLALVPAAPG